MAYNKIEANGKTLIDLTSDTVTADTLVSGRTAHLASGERVTGTFEPVTGVKGNAESTYRKGDVNLTAANIGAVNKTGDTMIGLLGIQTDNIDRNGEFPTSTTTANAFLTLRDKDNQAIGSVVSQQLADGAIRSCLYAINETADGNVVSNQFRVVTNKDGTFSYSMSSPSAFRTAIGLNNVNNTSDLDKPISTATQAALDSQQEQINYNTNNGVKNLLITDSKSGTVTSYGVTVTSNNDGTFTINGTNSNSGYTLIAMNLSDLSMRGGTGGINQITPKTIKSNKVKFYAIGLPSNLNFQLAKSTAVSTDGVSVNSVSGSAVSNVIDITNYGYVWFRLVAQANASYNNVVIKPMVVDASVTDTSDFVPYAEPNYQLTQKVDKALEQTGYNLLEITTANTATNGVTFTVDKAAGTVTANGTATADAYYNVTVPSNVYGNVCLSGCANGGSNSTYDVFPRDNTAGARPTKWNGTTTAESIYNENQWAEVKYVQGHSNLIQIRIRSGVTVSDLVFKPMIVEAELAGIPFQPYAKSNVELTQDMDDISGELDCLTIRAALVNNEVVIQNTSDFTYELYGKYYSETEPKFAILELHITSNTYYYKALINSSSVRQATVMEASFITVDGTYMSIYKFNWSLSGTVGTPTVSHTSLNLGS